MGLKPTSEHISTIILLRYEPKIPAQKQSAMKNRACSQNEDTSCQQKVQSDLKNERKKLHLGKHKTSLVLLP